MAVKQSLGTRTVYGGYALYTLRLLRNSWLQMTFLLQQVQRLFRNGG